ncbi:MAG: hypothetical protein HQ547_06930 [Candidatus Omnitrophica bacterium]|nr:hypothetical protein [Candidatus Omnitrophota bacterium]
MTRPYHQQTIEELQETLATVQLTHPHEKISGILLSKSLRFLSGEIAVAKQAISESIEKVIASNNRTSAINIALTIVMIFLTLAIAFSGLVQAGIIKFK